MYCYSNNCIYVVHIFTLGIGLDSWLKLTVAGTTHLVTFLELEGGCLNRVNLGIVPIELRKHQQNSALE